ncbi:hypothetical protein fsci_07800 [Francisella sciaenopsi]|uniref:Uncharacterized protein n=1 Tax=Francisella sciaenopsi TaxID=3055034 RepID=A0ABQ6PEB7_9GAMM
MALSSFLRSIILKCRAFANSKKDSIPSKTVFLKSKLDRATTKKFEGLRKEAHSAEKVIDNIVNPIAFGSFRNFVLM